MPRVLASMLVAAAALAGGDAAGHGAVPQPPFSPRSVSVARAEVVAGARPTNGRYEYVLLDGEIDVYREGSTALAERIVVPATRAGTRGVAVDPRRRVMYVSYGGDGGAHGTGSLLAYDLVAERIVWAKAYPVGIDSFALTPNGRKLYMPLGEAEAAPYWLVIDPRTGRATTWIDGGAYPHNTVVSLNGRRAYLAPRGDGWLTVVDTRTNRVIRRLGPLEEGVRPFTINGRQTLAFTTQTAHRGFQVESIASGKVLYTVDFGPVPAGFPLSAPSHGISLSPNEKQLWVLDAPASLVRVFDVARLPRVRPRQIAALKIPALGGGETRCAYDCDRSGWVQHTLDGKYVYVGDTGEFFSTRPARLAGSLPPLRDTRKHIEIDWRNGVPVATSTRHGLGRVTRKSGSARRRRD
jgi:hypothetical protein